MGSLFQIKTLTLLDATWAGMATREGVYCGVFGASHPVHQNHSTAFRCVDSWFDSSR